MRIILASVSPRRAQILRTLGLRFETETPRVEERPHPREKPADYVVRIASEKARAVALQDSGALVIGADTAVVVDTLTLGKPKDPADAARMLRVLRGREHSVFSGVALFLPRDGSIAAGFEESRVKFAPMSDEEIAWYVATGEGLDKAGAYAVQGKASLFIEGIAGSYVNVIGLPVRLLYTLAGRAGIDLKDDSLRAKTEN
jgi:septum formation protein